MEDLVFTTDPWKAPSGSDGGGNCAHGAAVVDEVPGKEQCVSCQGESMHNGGGEGGGNWRRIRTNGW